MRYSRIGTPYPTPNVARIYHLTGAYINTGEAHPTFDLALDCTLLLTYVPNLHQISTLCEGTTKERLEGLYSSFRDDSLLRLLKQPTSDCTTLNILIWPQFLKKNGGMLMKCPCLLQVFLREGKYPRKR